jgi:AcrR family transcriptional regulator
MEPPETHLPRKEPNQARSLHLVDSILKSATRLLSREGVDAATTNKIAQVAGVSIGSLYQYFPNREAILARLIERDLRSNEEDFLRRMELLRGLPLDEKITAVVETGYELFMRNRELKRVLFPHAIRLKRVREVIESRNTLAGIMAGLLRDHAHELRVENPERATYVLGHAVQGLLQTVMISKDPPYTDTEIKAEIVRMVRGYFGLTH